MLPSASTRLIPALLVLLAWPSGAGASEEDEPLPPAPPSYVLLNRLTQLTQPVNDPQLGVGRLEADRVLVYGVRRSPDQKVLDDLDQVLIILEEPHLDFEQYEMRARQGALWGDRDLRKLLNQEDGEDLRQGPLIPTSPGRPPLPVGPVARQGADQLAVLHELYLEGEVTWRYGDATTVFCQQLYLDVLSQRGVFMHATGFARGEQGGRVGALQLSANELRLLGRNRLQAHGADFTTCVYGKPHYDVRTGLAEVELGTADGRPVAETVRASGNRLRVEETSVVPLPPFTANLRAGEGLPLKEVRVGGSSKYGTYVNTLWADEIREVGQNMHDWLGVDAPFEGEWRFNVDYFSKRGIGLGPGVEYGSPGLYEGETGLYFINDQGDEDRTRLSSPEPNGEGDPFRRDVQPSERYRTFTRNRFHLAPNWRLDAESHFFSDENFQQEYFQEEFQEEKEPETYLHLVHQEGTGRSRILYRNRINDYDTQLDSLPQVTHDEVARSVGQIPGLGELVGMDQPAQLMLSYHADAANLRRHPADDVATTSEQVYRGDTFLEASTALDLGPFGFHPYTRGRFTAYDQTVDQKSNVGRVQGVAGARLQLPVSRTYNTLVEALKIDGMRHIAVFDVGYENTYASNRGAEEFIQLDDVDAADEFEEYVVGVRQRLQTWRNGEIVDFVFLDVEVPLYPDENRDNPVRVDSQGEPVGRTAGPLRTDFIYRPGWDLGPVTNITLRSESEWNLQDETFETFNAGISARPRADSFTALTYRTVRGQSRVLTGLFDWQVADKWSLATFQQWDLRNSNGLEQRYVVRRFSHDFLVELAYERDTAEDNNSVSISIRPLALTRPDRGYAANSGRNPQLYGQDGPDGY